MYTRRLTGLIVLLTVLVGAIIIVWAFSRPQVSAPLAPALDPSHEPVQTEPAHFAPITARRGQLNLQLWPQAQFSIDGLVVFRDPYHFDLAASLSPLDLSLAWGLIPQYRKFLDFSHGHRFVFYQVRANDLIDLTYAQQHIANIHTIPANANVRKALQMAKNHHPIRLRGELVNVTGTIGGRDFSWMTSLSRNDTGDGACEVMYVEEVGYDGGVYR